MIKAIMACDERLGIGLNGSIPWKHKDDMDFFRRATTGFGNNAIIMGRKTADSLGGSFPLGMRKNIVLSRSNREYKDRPVYTNLRDAIKESDDCDHIWIVGGREIYKEAFNLMVVEEVYITHIDGNYKCDTFMPISFNEISRNFNRVDEHRFEDYRLEVWRKK